MSWHFKEYEAIQRLKAAQKAITEALDYARRPHLYPSALFNINAALRSLTEAQWRLMQAKAEYKEEKV